MAEETLSDKVAIITGGARRIGAYIGRALHARGMRLVIHYRSSQDRARALQTELNEARPQSVQLVSGDLLAGADFLQRLVSETVKAFGRVDVLINNASSFYPTPLEEATEQQWENLIGTNLKTPFFLAQAAAPHLKATQGCIVNMGDIYGELPLKRYPIYSAAKAGVIMLTRSLARELGPEVRVNAIAPGAIMWPEDGLDESAKKRVIARTVLKRTGDPGDVMRAVLFLIADGGYITGQIIRVDGGRSIFL
ncbi:MAG: pteridine reductase [Acidiferrobacterales bacterium]